MNEELGDDKRESERLHLENLELARVHGHTTASGGCSRRAGRYSLATEGRFDDANA